MANVANREWLSTSEWALERSLEALEELLPVVAEYDMAYADTVCQQLTRLVKKTSQSLLARKNADIPGQMNLSDEYRNYWRDRVAAKSGDGTHSAPGWEANTSSSPTTTKGIEEES